MFGICLFKIYCTCQQVAVFSIDRDLLAEMSRTAKLGLSMDNFKGRSTLKLLQSIKTVPSAFPVTMNTCGRMCKWVKLFAFGLVSNVSPPPHLLTS